MMARGRALRVGASVLSIVMLARVNLCGAQSTDTPAPSNEPAFTAALVTDRFAHPVQITTCPRYPDELIVVERGGLAKRYSRKNALVREILDIEELVNENLPNGLSSIAFPPGQSEGKPFFFATYVDTQGDLVVARFAEAPGKPANDESMTVVIKVARIGSSVQGSQIAWFDGTLLISTADSENGPLPSSHTAQSMRSLLGKVLQVIPKAPSGYSLPTTSPFSRHTNALAEIWALGFRNPSHISVDQSTRRVFVIDNSDKTLEINLVESGKNYGWDRMEGTRCVSGDCDKDGLVPPILSVPKHSAGESLTGGLVYRGKKLPGIFGSFIFAESSSGTVFAAEQGTDKTWQYRPIITIPKKIISTIGQGNADDLYVGTQDGVLFEILPLNP